MIISFISFNVWENPFFFLKKVMKVGATYFFLILFLRFLHVMILSNNYHIIKEPSFSVTFAGRYLYDLNFFIFPPREFSIKFDTVKSRWSIVYILYTISLAISYVSQLYVLIFVQCRTISNAMTRTGY